MNEDALEEFLWWMCERQRIYKRKEIDGEDPPWTDDAILRDGHFCCVYRELDQGTRYLLDEIVGIGDPKDEFFNVITYRFINLPASFDAIGGFTPIDEFDVDATVQTLLDRQQRGQKVFSSAYRIAGQNLTDYDTKVEQVFYTGIAPFVGEIDDHVDDVIDADEPEVVIEVLKRMPGLGDFLAYEIYTDLTYTEWFPFGENDYVNIGPGAEGGLTRIFGNKDDRHLYWLVENQDFLFDKYDLDFFYWNGRKEKGLSLRDFEHSLCEYRKWCKVKDGGNLHRKYEYNPQQDLDDFH